MTRTDDYTPPEVWTWDVENGGHFASINRPIAGATHDKELPVGKHPFQLYSLATPNGVKVTIMFEELLALGFTDAEYDAWLIRIDQGDQFGSGFVGVNPNSKIPALMDYSTKTPTRTFESGAILLYLAEKFNAFLPTDVTARTECLPWLFWQWEAPLIWAVGLGIFTPMPPIKWNIQSTGLRWKPSVSLMFWTNVLALCRLLLGLIIQLPTWRSGHGTGN